MGGVWRWVAGWLTAAVVLLAGCAKGPDPDETVLTVWGVTVGPEDKGQADAIREFERRNPGVRVETLGMGMGGMNPQKLLTAIVGGTPPDVVYQDRFTIADWAARGAFEPLDPLIERDRATDPLTPTPEQYHAGPWAEASFEGRVYGIPWLADTRALYWNRAVFRERAAELRAAELDPTRPPRTWGELLAYSRILTDRGVKGEITRVGFAPLYGNASFTLYLLQTGAEPFPGDGTRVALDTPEARTALGFLGDACDVLGGFERSARFLARFPGEGDPAFYDGRVAMKVDGDWTLRGIARLAPDLDFGVAPPPVPDDRLAGPGRPAQTWSGGFAYCIPRGARNRELAWEFVKFVTSVEGRAIELRGQDDLNRARNQPSLPRLSAHRQFNAWAQREFEPADPRFAAALRVHLALLESAPPRPVSVAGRVLWDEQARAIDAVLRGSLAPEIALRTAERRVQAHLDEHARSRSRPPLDFRIPAALGVVGILAASVVVRARGRKAAPGPMGRREARWGLVFVAPWVVGFLAFTGGPLLASLVLSFSHYDGLQSPRWAGTDNFAAIVGADAPRVGTAFGNALYLAGLGVPLGLATGLAVALLLNSRVRGIGVYQALAYLPSIVPTVATAVLWVWILHPDPAVGLVNGLWERTVGVWFRIDPPGWFLVEEWAKPGLVLIGLWGAGGGAFLWLAGLRGVPREVEEAALLDGAGPWRRFAAVTLPLLSPLVLFNAVTGVIGALQTFDPVYVVTGGVGNGPNDAMLVPVTLLFQNGFGAFRIGYASALSWLLFAVVLLVTGLQFALARRWVYDEVSP